MPILFKVDGKNNGKDVSITITDSLGRQYNVAQIGILTHFSVKADYTMWETKSIINGGQVFYESVPHGVKVSLKLVRYSSGLEDMESDYRTAAEQGIQLEYALQYLVTNRNGSINMRLLRKGKPHNFNLGDYAADKDVDQSVDFVFAEIGRTK